MAGIQIQALRRTKIDLPGAGSDFLMPAFAQFIDTLGWRSGALLVRVYEKDMNGGEVIVQVVNTMVSGDDPSVTFIEQQPIAEIALPGGGSVDPELFTAPLPSSGVIGRYLAVRVLVRNGAAGSITLGVDLIGRST